MASGHPSVREHGARNLPLLCLGLAASFWIAPLRAQVPMPDPREMSGTPLPAPELPTGTITVRVIRGQLSNVVTGQAVELQAGPGVLTAQTDESGRARFDAVPAGTTVRALTTVDGERLESREFPMPPQGGVRVMLVAAAPGAESRGESASAPAAPVSGTVLLGGQTRFVIELGEETIQAYYLMEVMNPAQAPVQPPAPLVFEMPADAQGTTVLEGSSAQATAAGNRVTVTGPFPSGRSLVQAAYQLPYSGSRLHLAQRLPVPLERVTLIVRQLGDVDVASPQLTNQREVSAEGMDYILGTGPGLPKNGTLSIELTGLPHHSRTPRIIALGLSLAIVMVAAALAMPSRGGATGAKAARRRKLEDRRERLMAELVRNEEEWLAGRRDDRRREMRRSELVAQLERIYGELDTAPAPSAGAASSPAGRPRRTGDSVAAS